MELNKKMYSNGIALDAILEFDETIKEKRQTVILCHGHSRGKNDGLNELSHRLVKAGFATFRMDFRGCGINGDHRYSLYCGSEWIDDLMNAISYVSTLPIVDRTRIGVAGISMGACTVVSTTAADPRIKSTVSMSGIGDCHRWLKGVWERSGGSFDMFEKVLTKASETAAVTGHYNAFNTLDMYNMPEEAKADLINEAMIDGGVNAYVTLQSLYSMLYYRPVDRCHRITTPIFFLHGTNDPIVPFEESQTMHDACSSETKKIKLYQGMEHNIPIEPKRDEAFADIIKWFEETL